MFSKCCHVLLNNLIVATLKKSGTTKVPPKILNKTIQNKNFNHSHFIYIINHFVCTVHDTNHLSYFQPSWLAAGLVFGGRPRLLGHPGVL